MLEGNDRVTRAGTEDAIGGQPALRGIADLDVDYDDDHSGERAFTPSTIDGTVERIHAPSGRSSPAQYADRSRRDE